jgi:Zn-dependent protease with chaperone function
MEEATILYYDGTSARPEPVRVLVFGNEAHLYTESENSLIQRFPLATMTHNQAGSSHYIYLDPKGLQYLQLPPEHPLAITLSKEIAGAGRNWSHRLMKQRTAVLLPLLLLMVVGFYIGIVSLVPLIGSRMIGVRQEIKIGNKLKEAMLQEATLLGAHIDQDGTRNLQAFADRLKLSRQYPIRLTLVNSDVVNAYALPGGQIVVYSGLLQKIETPEALAALLAHESAHVNERHSLRSLLRNAASAILLSVVFNDATGISAALVGNVNTLNGLRYSRSLEAEADEEGMNLLMANHIDLNGMRVLMQILQKEGDAPEQLSFLSTHPLTKDRIKKAERYIQKQPQQVTKQADLEGLFKTLKQRL